MTLFQRSSLPPHSVSVHSKRSGQQLFTQQHVVVSIRSEIYNDTAGRASAVTNRTIRVLTAMTQMMQHRHLRTGSRSMYISWQPSLITPENMHVTSNTLN